MLKKIAISSLALALALSPANVMAKSKSKGQKAQEEGVAQIPTCTKKLGTISVVEPEDRWWSRYKLQSPEALIKYFAARSGCFGVVDRNKGLRSSQAERALAAAGELQRGSNIGKRQIKAADYVMVPDLITANSKSGGTGIAGGVAGALGGGAFGGLLGRAKINKKEANVTLSLVNVRTTEMESITEGYARKSDVKWGAGGGGWFGALAGAGVSGYTDTQIGRVISLAYLNAFTDMVGRLGGLPADASAAAPAAE